MSHSFAFTMTMTMALFGSDDGASAQSDVGLRPDMPYLALLWRWLVPHAYKLSRSHLHRCCDVVYDDDVWRCVIMMLYMMLTKYVMMFCDVCCLLIYELMHDDEWNTKWDNWSMILCLYFACSLLYFRLDCFDISPLCFVGPLSLYWQCADNSK